MRLFCSTRTMPGADLPEENPLPRFRDREHDKVPDSDGTLSGAELEGLGRHTGFRVLPYCMQDRYTLERRERTYDTVVLENQFLRAEFLPQLGGRLWSLFDKERERELVFRNPVFQPANLAIRDAWFSGGVEWNVAQTGHTYSTCDRLFCARMEEPGGGAFLRMYDYVRTTGLLWQIDFHLPDGARALWAHVRITNPRAGAVPLYWWTNTAVPMEKRLRVFSCTDEVIYIHPESLEKEGGVHGYGRARLPHLPSMPGTDATYPQNSAYTNEYFFQNGPEVRCPWEAAAYDDGFVFLERSTQPLRIRKMFCWGNHPGGRSWIERLSAPGKGDYVEIQAGLAPTQVHGMDLAGGGTVEFTQAFGGMTLSPGVTHAPDWHAARDAVERAAESALPAETLEKAHRAYTAAADRPCGELLCLGRGWGCLEAARRAAEGENSLPACVSFPTDSMGPEERRWYGLLAGASLPCLEPDELPRSWMTDRRWAPYLRHALEREPENNALLVHLGTLLYENGAEEQAEELWRRAGDCAVALRDRAVACSRRGAEDEALACLERAFSIQGGRELAGEYLSQLNKMGRYEEAWRVYQALSPESAGDERVMITAAAAALEVGDEAFLARVFAYPFAVIREGETQMTDLWFQHEARLRARRAGCTDLDALERELRASVLPPRNIDYRLTQR